MYNTNNKQVNNKRLCQSVPSISLSARFYTELQQLQYGNEPPPNNQHRSTLNSMEMSRNISSKQSCRTSMPCLTNSVKKKPRLIGLKSRPALIYMPGLKEEQVEIQEKKEKKIQLTPHLKSPIKHFSFEFRNKWTAMYKN